MTSNLRVFPGSRSALFRTFLPLSVSISCRPSFSMHHAFDCVNKDFGCFLVRVFVEWFGEGVCVPRQSVGRLNVSAVTPWRPVAGLARRPRNDPSGMAHKQWCSLCGKYYSSAAKLKRHLTLHYLQRKFYQCSFCPRRYSWMETLQVHLKRAHGDKMAPCHQPWCCEGLWRDSRHATSWFRELTLGCCGVTWRSSTRGSNESWKYRVRLLYAPYCCSRYCFKQSAVRLGVLGAVAFGSVVSASVTAVRIERGNLFIQWMPVSIQISDIGCLIGPC